MTGWTKVFLATAIMVVALAGFNLALWRRLREARRLAAIEAADPDRAPPPDGQPDGNGTERPS